MNLPNMDRERADEVQSFFEHLYSTHERYWWLGDNRFSINPSDHTPHNRALLVAAAAMGGGRALDLGAGEGIDAIRLAMLGFIVDAVELTNSGANKIMRLAQEAKVAVNVIQASVLSFVAHEYYDIILCNGVLHYIHDKSTVIDLMKRHTASGGLNSISLFSTATPVPACHTAPLFPDHESGIVVTAYADWIDELTLFERSKPESSHAEMEPHVHSYIKLLRRKTSEH